MTEYYGSELFEECTARTLTKVVPVASKESASGVTVALTALEIYQNGNGILRYLISLDSRSTRSFASLPGPQIEVEDDAGRLLPTQLLDTGASERTASGLLQVAGLPGSGKIAVKVLRVASRKHATDFSSRTQQGPWIFEFRI